MSCVQTDYGFCDMVRPRKSREYKKKKVKRGQVSGRHHLDIYTEETRELVLSGVTTGHRTSDDRGVRKVVGCLE